MAFSIQTNINSLIAQENLRVNSDFQSRTIQRLTSGFRINQSGDDAAGLAIANKFRSDIAELSQGVRNANDGISTLQIVDGGMNNISKMIDRLKTLASQSASGTFTGDRNVLNSEFQSVLSEIDRQAQAVGLDQGGQFAKSLSVFIGGGKTHTGGVDIANGSITVDLSRSTVDARSLGLKGMQVVAGTEDIGTGSATHTVAQIKADAANTTATGGFTDFYFAGPGFSDNSKVKVSVNLSSVTDIDSLVTAINSAISSAGSGATQAATAFKNANIVASVHTDATGGKQLAFTSSTTAFQVEAGDRMANAFMGNLTGTTGDAIATTVTTGATTAGAISTPENITVRITGAGLASPVDLVLDSASTTTALAITDLTNQVATNAALQAAGITVSSAGAGSAFVFTSARGEKFSVQATGDTANRLGMGSFVAGTSAAPDYTTLTGGAAYDNTAAYGTAHLEFSINGAASNANAVSIDLDAGDATAASATGTQAGALVGGVDADGHVLNLTVNGTARVVTIAGATTTVAQVAAQINTQGAAWGLTATVDEAGHLKITSNTKGASSEINITGGNLATDVGLAVADHSGASRTAADVVAALNTAFSTDAELQKAGLTATEAAGVITIASSNNTYFRINAGTSGASADVGFGVAGAVFADNLTAAAANFAVSDSNGAWNSGSLTFAALQYGNDDQALTISANDSSSGALQTMTITLKNDAAATRNGRSIDEAIAYINAQLQQSNNATLQKIVAVKENAAGAEKINFLSSLSSFNVSLGSSINSDGVGGGTPASVAGAALGTGGNMSVDTAAAASAAVLALAGAITTLGSAQAAVGKAQNQLGYALGLAQSQAASFAAAESRIRDADIAAEAANLTKAQVLQQASMAAMAQANSAPQAVMALLRG